MVCISLLAASSSLFGQADRGIITGIVTDPSGAVLAGAKITAINAATNEASTTNTTQTGNYTLPALVIGQYRVEVEAAGFKRGVHDNLTISAASTVRLDVVLEVGSVSETLQVTATANPMDTETTRVATNISNKLVEEVPLVVSGTIRSVFNLATLAPELKTGENYRIGGGQAVGWDMVMDGASITVAAGTKQASRAQISAVSVDAISEFTVETTGMKAEYGRASGLINFVTKSGTDTLHGNAFEYLRNDAVDARGFFAATRPKLRQSDFGGTLGGPIVIPRVYNGKNKTFFFLSYEGFSSRQGNAAAFFTVPLPAMYQGDFSGWTKGGKMIQLYDPDTTRVNPSGGYVRDPFANNQIPLSRFSQVASKYIALRPADMVPNIGGPTNNYFLQNGSMTYPWNKGSARVDHQLTKKDAVTFFFMKAENQDAPGAEGVPGLQYPYETGPALWDRELTYYKASWNRTITPHVLSSLRYNKNIATDFTYSASCTYPDQNWGALLNLKNVPGPDRCLPAVTMTNYANWGAATWGNDNGWNSSIAEDLTYVRGSHTFKGGGYYSRDQWAGGGNDKPNGAYGFSYLATAIPGDQSQNTGNAFASMLLGYVDNASMDQARREFFTWKHFGGYFQDDWRVNPKLVVNMGLRYDFTFALTGGNQVTAFKNASDIFGYNAAPSVELGFSNFDPTRPNPGAGGLPGATVFTGTGSGRTGNQSPFGNWPWAFQPRLGLAYSVRPGTTLRVSAGRSFQDVKNQGGTTHTDGFASSLTWPSTDLDVNNFPMLLDKGLPAWSLPPNLQPDVLNGQAINWWNPSLAQRPSEFWNWNFDIQRQLASSTVLTLRYSGSKGTHLLSGLVNANQISPSYLATIGPTLLRSNITSAAAIAAGFKPPYPGFNGTVQQALQPFPQYLAISQGLEHLGDSTYHAMVLTVDRRFSGGFSALASYVFSKMFTDADSATSGVAAMDSFNLRLQKGLSADDQTHMIRYSAVYDLPFGKGKRFLPTGIAAQVLGGWTLSGTGEYSSGSPLSVAPGITLPFGGGDRVFVTSYSNWRAATAGSSFDPFKDSWWDKSAFNQVPTSVANAQLGNATRNNPQARSPWLLNENISLAKNIPVRERIRFTLRLEAFNLLNRVQWGAPDSTLTSPTFGQVRTQANSPRTMQAALKLTF